MDISALEFGKYDNGRGRAYVLPRDKSHYHFHCAIGEIGDRRLELASYNRRGVVFTNGDRMVIDIDNYEEISSMFGVDWEYLERILDL